MAIPACQTYPPKNLQPYGATFTGKCSSMGGLPTKFYFKYLTWPSRYWHTSPKWDVDHDDEEFEWLCADLHYSGASSCFAIVENADGVHWGQEYRFWCPLPTKVDVGAPWLIKLNTGAFTDTHYNWLCITDIACKLHVLVGTVKPRMSPHTHITRGVVFHHDPRLYFHWKWRVYQHQEGDCTTHTFAIPYSLENQTYWFMALGSVDGKVSPSISPPFSFRRRSVPNMRVLDATGITQSTATLHGLLYDDKGAPCYVRMRYTKVDDYTNYTPKIGPKPSKYWWGEDIDSLDPDTEYKFGSIGSHDKGMTRYGWSMPKYFRTLPPTLKCYSDPVFAGYWSCYGGGGRSYPIEPLITHNLSRFDLSFRRPDMGTPQPTKFIFAVHNAGDNMYPTDPPLFSVLVTLPVYPDQQWYTCSIPVSGVSVQAGVPYVVSVVFPVEGNPDPTDQITLRRGTDDICPATPHSGWNWYWSLGWFSFSEVYDLYYQTY